MRRRDCFAGLTLLLTASRVAAAEARAPAQRLDESLFGRLEGRWNLTRAVRGTEVRNVVTATWVLQRRFLQVHMQDVATPPRYEALVLIGSDAATGRYVAHWTDTYGGHFSALGHGVQTGNAVEFRFDYEDGPFFNTFVWFPDEDRWTCRLENQAADGSRELFALDTLVRAS